MKGLFVVILLFVFLSFKQLPAQSAKPGLGRIPIKAFANVDKAYLYKDGDFIASAYIDGQIPLPIILRFYDSCFWCCKFPGKVVPYKDQVSIGIRKMEDFTLFFPAPVRPKETAVYVDGVKLINP